MIQTSSTDRKLVKNWLKENGFTRDEMFWFADSVKLTSHMSKFERLFGRKMFILKKKYPVFSRDTVFQLPDHIRPIIEVIDGNHHQYQIKRIPVRDRSIDEYLYDSNADPGLVTTEVLQRIYQIPQDKLPLNGNLTSVGAMEYRGAYGFSQSNLKTSQKENGLKVQQISKNNIIGNNISPDGESQLDVQMIAQTAPGAQMWYEIFDGWMFSWATDFFNRKRIPYIVSISWGWNEDDQCSLGTGICNNENSQEYVRRANYEFMKLAARGVTILVSSGDAGSPGRTDEICQPINNQTMNPVFPGSSKWVTSVGATYLVAPKLNSGNSSARTPVCRKEDCAQGNVERGVTIAHQEMFWTSGAGFDRWEQTPAWQYHEVLSYLNSGVEFPAQTYWNRGNRAYPDVSAIGHNCAVNEGGFWSPNDGTSCSSPVFAGVLAILNDHQMKQGKPRIGFANPLLYTMSKSDSSTFHDIAHGNSSCTEMECCGPNYGFVARQGGWDPVTGLGTPNVANMLAWLDKHT